MPRREAQNCTPDFPGWREEKGGLPPLTREDPEMPTPASKARHLTIDRRSIESYFERAS
jgi:hypothetical protein